MSLNTNVPHLPLSKLAFSKGVLMLNVWGFCV